MHCKCTGLTTYVNVSAYIATYTDLASPGAYPNLVSPPMYVWNLFIKKQNKEFKTALIASFILPLIGVNIVMLMNTITTDKTHNIYDLIYAVSTYMIL